MPFEALTQRDLTRATKYPYEFLEVVVRHSGCTLKEVVVVITLMRVGLDQDCLGMMLQLSETEVKATLRSGVLNTTLSHQSCIGVQPTTTRGASSQDTTVDC